MRLDAASDRDEVLQLRLTVPRGATGFVPRWARDYSLGAVRRGSWRPLVYPPGLREQRVEGRVVLGLVVDSLGRVDPATSFALETSHPLFLTSVRAAVRGFVYDPAIARSGAG